jgi:hypothetical protein
MLIEMVNIDSCNFAVQRLQQRYYVVAETGYFSMDKAPHGGDPAVARAARALAPLLPGWG